MWEMSKNKTPERRSAVARMTREKGGEPPAPASVLRPWANGKVSKHHTLPGQVPRAADPAARGCRGVRPGDPRPGSERREAPTMKSRRLLREACCLGAILLSHKCFEFLSLPCRISASPRHRARIVDRHGLSSAGEGQARPAEEPQPSLLERSPEGARALAVPQAPRTQAFGPHAHPRAASHSEITLSQGRCQGPGRMTSSGNR